jgi:carbonic anhydrase/acetyltransferase-like protein (isoleucine patch superfamily)
MIDINKKTWLPVRTLVPIFFSIFAALPLALAAYPVLFIESPTYRLLAVVIAPFTFTVSLVITCGALSLPFQRAVVPGKFPRTLDNFVYGPRRLYGLCWGAVFYCTPVYYALLSIPTLRSIVLRSFGYRGHLDVNIAPDAWIRDLPVLHLSQGAYVANKATIATNMCLSDGSVFVDRVSLGKKCMIGHMAMVAPGFSSGDDSEVGAGAALGIRSKIGQKTRIGPKTTVNHGAQLGTGVEIGTMSYIGLKAKILDGIKLPSGSNIPDGAEINTQEEALKFFSSETLSLLEERTRLERIHISRSRAEDSGTEINPPPIQSLK